MVAADVVPMVDMSLKEADAARVLKIAAVTSGFFYGVITSSVVFMQSSLSPPPPPHLSASETCWYRQTFACPSRGLPPTRC